jgi:hypothetical protein
LLDVVLLQGVAVYTTGTLQLGAETDSSGELDDGGLVGNLLGLGDSSLDALKVGVSVLDVLGVPSVRLESLEDVLSECALGVTICNCVSS